MIKNYIIIAIRSLIRHRFFSIISILGLAISMSVCMGIIMLVADQMNHDRYNSKCDRIFRVNTAKVMNNGVLDDQQSSTSSFPLRQELLENYSGIEKIVRFRDDFGNGWIELFQNVNIPLAGYYADPEVFEMFEYEFQYGDPVTALKEPYTVVLTRKAANKLFKAENPLGQTIKVGQMTYTVTGILKETTRKSHIAFEALASMATVENDGIMSVWTNYWHGWTYILVEPGQSATTIQQHLDKIYKKRIEGITDPSVIKMKFLVQPLLYITLASRINNPIGPVLPLTIIYFLGSLALVILLTSCFNFTNLSIARSLTRAREIGVRKVTGATRWQIFVQFLSESIIVAFVSLALATLFLLLIKPMIIQFNLARILRWDLESNLNVYALFIVFASVVGILAGFYPAVVLSGFQPVKVLKGVTNLKLFSRLGLRKFLLISQFTLSLFFILSVIVVFNQFTLFTHQDHGFNLESNIIIRLNSTSAQNLKNELLKYPNITSIAAASHVPAAGGTFKNNGFKKKLDDPDWITMEYFWTDEGYLDNMKIRLIAGDFFNAGLEKANENKIVINQQAVKKFNFESAQAAIGQELILRNDSTRTTIIGVIQDYNHRDLNSEITPMSLLYNSDQFKIIQVAYIGTYENAVKVIETAWASVNPGLKIDYKEMRTEINQFYEIVYGNISKILGVISFLAIFISCLGLLGMAAYTTETRLKEISIRKVFGSSRLSLVLLLSRGFLMMLGWAVLIGAPLAYFINNLWLKLIAYHTTMGWIVILQGVLVLVSFGVITVGSQIIRATFLNPIENLKGE